MTTIVAQRNPDATVLGIDLNPIQPNAIPPSNVTFKLDDVTKSWTGMYDYVHIRQMVYDVSDWEYLFEQAFK